MNHDNIILLCKRVKFHSYKDEEAFFEWIKKIGAIKDISAAGNELYLHIADIDLPDDDFRELIGLFYRYKVDMKQLKIFLNEKNREWLCGKPYGYWYKKIFGSK